MQTKINYAKVKSSENKMKRAFDYFNELLETNEFTLGGSVFSNFYTKTLVKDFDIFFRSQDAFEKAIATLYRKGYCENGERQAGENAYTLVKKQQTPIDLIYIPEMNQEKRMGESLVELFDFTMSAVAHDKYGMVYHQDFLNDFHSKTLRTLNPKRITSLERIKSLMERGYSFNSRTMERLHSFSEEARGFLFKGSKKKRKGNSPFERNNCPLKIKLETYTCQNINEYSYLEN